MIPTKETVESRSSSVAWNDELGDCFDMGVGLLDEPKTMSSEARHAVLLLGAMPGLRATLRNCLWRWGYDYHVLLEDENVVSIVQALRPTIMLMDLGEKWAARMTMARKLRSITADTAQMFVGVVDDETPKQRHESIRAGIDLLIPHRDIRQCLDTLLLLDSMRKELWHSSLRASSFHNTDQLVSVEASD